MLNAELAITESPEPEAHSDRGSMPAETIQTATNDVGGSEKHIAKPDPTDSELVRLTKEGDGKAFRKLMERHQGKVHRLAMRFVRNETDAEDVVQEVFINVFRKIGDFKESSAFSTWLYPIVVNQALMLLRQRRREPYDETADLDSAKDIGPAMTSGLGANPLRELERRKMVEQIRSAVESLNPILRKVFIIRHVEGMSTNDTADITGLSVPAVKTRLHRARVELREVLKRHREDDLTV